MRYKVSGRYLGHTENQYRNRETGEINISHRWNFSLEDADGNSEIWSVAVPSIYRDSIEEYAASLPDPFEVADFIHEVKSTKNGITSSILVI